ncbi:conserved hypothetical protein [Xanthomonas oryzae pv. oryzae KACC 10331]|uniref:Uncharacterized protein n=1 Tax=Xanthomonas oryzae pv. oryzae (strain KACC10331 / KXO85) TaxID=291331 RepID=Q5H6B5_XANOR|nr:conserved hypothetical protein [Xanthomonas oryzae pv. oryzae KACC 10331]
MSLPWRAARGARRTHDQLRNHLRQRWRCGVCRQCRRIDQLLAQQQLQRARAQAGDIHPHRGQRRQHIARHRHIVEPGQRDVLRHLEPGMAQREQAAQRHHVVGGEDRIRTRVLGQRLAGAVAGFFVEVAWQHPRLRVCIHRHFIVIPAQALMRIEVVVRPGDEGDAAVPTVAQVAGHDPRAAVVVDIEYRALAGAAGAVEQHRRQAAGQRIFMHARIAQRWRHHHHPVHAPGQALQRPALRLRVAVRAGHQQVISLVVCHLVDAADQLGKEFAMQVRQHDSNGVGAPAAEAARGVVRDVVERTRHLQYAFAHRLGHMLMPVHGARDRGHRYLRFARNVLDGDATAFGPWPAHAVAFSKSTRVAAHAGVGRPIRWRRAGVSHMHMNDISPI